MEHATLNELDWVRAHPHEAEEQGLAMAVAMGCLLASDVQQSFCDANPCSLVEGRRSSAPTIWYTRTIARKQGSHKRTALTVVLILKLNTAVPAV
jgi:hypothetical protein